MGHYFGWVGVGGALFCVGGSEWVNILGGWAWVGMSGGEGRWVHCLIMPINIRYTCFL